MNTTTVSDAILSRASVLHDAAYADASFKEKPSWAESVAAAQAEADRQAAAEAQAAVADARAAEAAAEEPPAVVPHE